jgi:hypothetical protein
MNIHPNIKLRLLDVNNFSIEKELDLTSLFFKDLLDYDKYFMQFGIIINDVHWSIQTKSLLRDSFYEWILSHLFPHHHLKNNQYPHTDKENGSPDYHLTAKKEYEHIYKNHKDNEIWVEIKRKNDGLKNNQLSWMIDNRDKKTIKILFVLEDMPNLYDNGDENG